MCTKFQVILTSLDMTKNWQYLIPFISLQRNGVFLEIGENMVHWMKFIVKFVYENCNVVNCQFRCQWWGRKFQYVGSRNESWLEWIIGRMQSKGCSRIKKCRTKSMASNGLFIDHWISKSGNGIIFSRNLISVFIFFFLQMYFSLTCPSHCNGHTVPDLVKLGIFLNLDEFLIGQRCKLNLFHCTQFWRRLD